MFIQFITIHFLMSNESDYANSNPLLPQWMATLNLSAIICLLPYSGNLRRLKLHERIN